MDDFSFLEIKLIWVCNSYSILGDWYKVSRNIRDTTVSYGKRFEGAELGES